jgi:hypothetical protein
LEREVPQVSPDRVEVAVIGSGIAGLTAALELAKRGYAVSVYEREEAIGGNLSSQRYEVEVKGEPDEGEVSSQKREVLYQDVYPHMYPSWYANFWRLVESELGLSREGNFEARRGTKMLRRGSDHYIELLNPTTLKATWGNLTSGFLPLPDMFIYGYSMIDLAAQQFDRDQLLSRYSLNGFLQSRGYTTERAAEMVDLSLMEIWSVHGNRTSAAAYKDFVRRGFALGTDQPFAWMLKGSSYEKLIRPLVAKLEGYDGCAVHTGCRLDTIDLEINAGRARAQLTFNQDSDTSSSVTADYLILAVDPESLGCLIQSGKHGFRIDEMLPELLGIRRLGAEPIAVVDVYFKRELSDVPSEHVGLAGSPMSLSFFQISGLWEDDPNMRGRTVLVLAASDSYALSLLEGSEEEDGYLMIQGLHEYLPIFRLGEHWGDESSDVDWERSRFRANLNNKLFINEVGSGEWSPCASYQALPNVFFAGDFCRNAIAMATVEGAVLSGLEAAQALWSRHPMGDPIEILEVEPRSERWLLSMKLAFAATAYWARWWSIAFDAVEPVSRGYFSTLPRAAAEMLYLPYSFGGDVLKTGYALLENLLRGEERPGGGR